jgi:hypothetical protein
VHGGRVEFTRFKEFFDFGNGDATSGRDQGIEILGAGFVHQVPVAVAVAGVDEGVVRANGVFENVVAPAEFANFFGL